MEVSSELEAGQVQLEAALQPLPAQRPFQVIHHVPGQAGALDQGVTPAILDEGGQLLHLGLCSRRQEARRQGAG